MNIAEVLETKEAESEEILEMYQKAKSLAETAGNQKLVFKALSEIIELLKKDNRLFDASKCSQHVMK